PLPGSDSKAERLEILQQVRCSPLGVLLTRLPFAGALEPLLVRRCLLPALVGFARTDPVHVGTQVAAAGALALAGAVCVQPEVLGGELRRVGDGRGKEVASLIAGAALQRIGLVDSPELLPVRQRLAASRCLGLCPIGGPAEEIDVRGV